MKTKYLLLFGALVFLFSACGQKERDRGYSEREQMNGFPQFNRNTVEKISGEVLSVVSVPDPQYGSVVHILVRTNKGEIPVHLGPSWFVEGNEMQIIPGDMVEVEGSQIYIEGRVFVIASELKKDDYVLKLRDRDGNPLWVGWKRS